MELEKLVTIGSQLGLEGESLKEWMEEQIKHEREERAAKREQLQLENEKARLENEKARSQAMMVEKQLELERMRLDNPIPSPGSSTTSQVPIKGPKIPVFNEDKDSMDSYLERFERFASLHNWDRSTWATHLSVLLTGKSLDVYTRMDIREAECYDTLKQALLVRYNLTADGFSRRFRTATPQNGESISQFVVRIRSYFEKWIEMDGKDKDPADDVIDLMIKDQLLSTCGKELNVFIRERNAKTVLEVVELAENYISAHGMTNSFHKPINHMTKKVEKATESRDEQHPNKIQRSPGSQLICHRCSKPGHKSRDCRSRPHNVATLVSPLYCTVCKRKGHDQSTCWKKRNEIKGKAPEVVSTIINDVEENDLHVLTAICTNEEDRVTNMPISKGRLNKKDVTVMRDSGCTCIVVKKNLVAKSCLSGKTTKVCLADGRIISAPLADVYLKSPYLSGKVSVVLMENLLHYVIIGNVSGAKCPGIHVHNNSSAKVAAMETRNRRQRNSKPLKPVLAPKMDVTVQELSQLQQEDDSLNECFNMAKRRKVKETGRDRKTWYEIDRGVLYRLFQAPTVRNGDVLKQIVIPKALRTGVIKIMHERILGVHLPVKQTTDRIMAKFFWPNVWGDVRRHCQSCVTCLRSAPRNKTTEVSQSNTPRIDHPFKRTTVDPINPIHPASNRGYRFNPRFSRSRKSFPNYLPQI